MDKKLKIIIISLGFFIAVPIIIWLVALFNPAKNITTGIRFISVPDSIQVKGNNISEKINFGSVVSLPEGSYKLTFSRDGFDNQEKDVSVSSGNLTTLCVQLSANNQTGQDILASEKNLSSKAEGVYGCLVSEGSKKLEVNYPFINQLPIIDKYFSANVCQDSSDASIKYIICVKLVLSNDFQKNRAIDSLKSHGIDTNSVKVRFLEPSTE